MLDDKNVRWYTGQNETFIVIGKREGISETPGERGYWCHLLNLASLKDGWVFAKYVVPTDQSVMQLLKQMFTPEQPATGSSGSSFRVTEILATVLTLLTAVLLMLKIKIKLLKIKKQALAHQPPEPPANDNASNPLPNQEPAPIFFGSSGGNPWFYRPKARHQGGGVKSA